MYVIHTDAQPNFQTHTPEERRKESNGKVEDCRGGGGGVGISGGEARVEVEDVGQWDMRGREGTLKSLIRLICNVCA